jgi:hypothetical protein
LKIVLALAVSVRSLEGHAQNPVHWVYSVKKLDGNMGLIQYQISRDRSALEAQSSHLKAWLLSLYQV